MSRELNKPKTNHYFVLSAIVVLIIALVCFIVLSNRQRYYDCQTYLDGQNIYSPVANVDRLKGFDYYRIYLNEDGTFVLKYRLVESKTEREETGTYKFKNDNTKLVLTYDKEEPATELAQVCTYTVEDDYLVRDEEVYTEINGTFYYYSVMQKFKYK